MGVLPVLGCTAEKVIADNCSAERLVAEFGCAGRPGGDDRCVGCEEFQAVFDRDDPESSGFPESTTAAWHARGEPLGAGCPVRVGFHTACGDRVFGG